MSVKSVTIKHMNIEVGDTITFKAVTRYSHEKVSRKVTGVYDADGKVSVGVRYQGWSPFFVRPEEVISVTKPVKTEDPIQAYCEKWCHHYMDPETGSCGVCPKRNNCMLK